MVPTCPHVNVREETVDLGRYIRVAKVCTDCGITIWYIDLPKTEVTNGSS